MHCWIWYSHNRNGDSLTSFCRQPLLQQQQQQQQQLTLAAPQDNYLASRNQALHEVESAIRDIGGIFQQLAHMVRAVNRHIDMCTKAQNGLQAFSPNLNACWLADPRQHHSQSILSACPEFQVQTHVWAVGRASSNKKLLVAQVEEQGELAIRIDENVDETLSNVDSAQDQLLKYLNSVSSNRWLIMKIFFVLMVFLVVFVVFVAWYWCCSKVMVLISYIACEKSRQYAILLVK